MNWPLSQDYNEAIQNPALCFGDPDLKSGEVPTGPLGIPVPRSGNFADVYQVKGGDGSVWAVKCFTRKVTGLRERYALIDEHLRQSNLPFTVTFTYQEEGIRVKGQWFPIVKMEWVEGFTLNEFTRDNLDKPQILQALLTIWGRLSKRLREVEIAHADLQHGNVLLVPGFSAARLGLKLIDYDGMWIPALAGKNSGEVGHAAYQHPLRAANRIFGPDVDRFPHLVVAAALRGAILGGQALWQQFDNGDNLLFREDDFKDPAGSELFKKLAAFKDPTLNALIANLAIGAKKPLDKTPWLDQLIPEDKPAVLTPIQEKEAAQILGYSLQRKGTETNKALGTTLTKSLGSNQWSDSDAKNKAAAAPESAFASLTTKPGEIAKRKGSKLPLILGGFVAAALIAVCTFILMPGHKNKDVSKIDPSSELKADEPKKDEDPKKEEPKKDVTPKKEEIAPKKEEPPPKEVPALDLRLLPLQQMQVRAKLARIVPDGSNAIAFVTQADPGSVEIIDPAGEEPRKIPLDDGRKALDVQFSGDGKRMAVADDKGEIQVIDVDSGNVVRAVPSNSKGIIGMGLTADGTILFFAIKEGSQITTVNVENGQENQLPVAAPILDVGYKSTTNEILACTEAGVTAFDLGKSSSVNKNKEYRYLRVGYSADGRQIVYLRQKDAAFTVSHSTGPDTIHSVPLKLPAASELLFDDGSRWFAALTPKGLTFFDGKAGKALAEYPGPAEFVHVEAMRDNKIMLLDKEGTIRVLEWEVGKPEIARTNAGSKELEKILSFPGAASWNCIDFAPESGDLVFGSNDDPKLHRYSLTNRKMALEWVSGKVTSVRAGKDDTVMAQVTASLVKVWDAQGQNPILVDFPGEIVTAIRGYRTDKIYGGSQDGRIYYAQNADYSNRGTRPAYPKDRRVRCCEITHNSAFICSIDDTGEICVGWSGTGDARNYYYLQDTSRNALKVHISPDATLVLGYGVGNEVQVWDVLKKELKYTLKGHSDTIVDARFTPDNKYIVTAAKDKTVKLWSAEDGKLLKQASLTDVPTAITVSKDSKLLAVAKGAEPTGQIDIWALPEPGAPVLANKIPRTKTAVAAKNDVPKEMMGAAQFEPGTGRVFTMNLEADSIRTIGYSADGKKLVIVRRSGTATIHDAENMKELFRIEIDKGGCTAAAISGDLLYAAGSDNKIHYWDLNTKKLIKEMAAPHRALVQGLYPFDTGKSLLVKDDQGFASYALPFTGKPRTYNVPTSFSGSDPTKFTAIQLSRRAYGVDGSTLASWTADDGSNKRLLADFEYTVQSFTATPAGQKLAGVTSYAISVCDSTGKLIVRIPLRAGTSAVETVHGLQFADNGKELVGMSSSSVRVWDAAKGALLKKFDMGMYGYEAACASTDGRWYALVCGFRADGNTGKHQLSIWRLTDEKKK